MIPASKFGKSKDKNDSLEFTQKETEMTSTLKNIWSKILNIEINNNTDFFVSGAGSMDIVR